MHELDLRGDTELGVHRHNIWSVIERTNDVASPDVCVVEQRHQLLVFQLGAWAVVFHVPHHQQLVANAMATQPFFRQSAIHDRTRSEDDDVATGVDVQIVVVGCVEAAQRMVVVVAVQRIFCCPVDLGDAPTVVSDAVVNVKNNNAHVSPRFQIYIQIRGVLLPIRTIELSRVFGGSRTPTCPTPLCLLL